MPVLVLSFFFGNSLDISEVQSSSDVRVLSRNFVLGGKLNHEEDVGGGECALSCACVYKPL